MRTKTEIAADTTTVKKALSKKTPFSKNEISEKTKLSAAVVGGILAGFVKDGTATKHSDKKWAKYTLS